MISTIARLVGYGYLLIRYHIDVKLLGKFLALIWHIMMNIRLGARTSVGFLIFAFSAPAYAYIDPGIGGIIFQGLIAGMIVAGVYWRLLKIRVLQLFGKKKEEEPPVPSEHNNESDRPDC